jgi:hypothetical protein
MNQHLRQHTRKGQRHQLIKVHGDENDGDGEDEGEQNRQSVTIFSYSPDSPNIATLRENMPVNTIIGTFIDVEGESDINAGTLKVASPADKFVLKAMDDSWKLVSLFSADYEEEASHA